MYWTSDKIEAELDRLGSINRHNVRPLLYRIRDDYEDKIADMPFVEAVRIRLLEERIERMQRYIDDLEVLHYGRTLSASV